MELDETYRTIKNEDYERLFALANLHEKAIKEVVKEALIDTEKEIEDFRHIIKKSKITNGEFYELNNELLTTLREMISLIPYHVFRECHNEYRKLLRKNFEIK